MILLRRTCDLLELEFSETAGEFAATNQYEREGSVTVIDWIRHNCKMGGHAAADRVCVGEQLARLPLSSEALAEGQIGFAHLSPLGHTARALSEAPNGRGFEEGKLLEKAVESSPGRFRHVCQHARHASDPEGFAAKEQALSEARQLQLKSCPDGVLMVQGRLDPQSGAVLRTALEPRARPAGSDDSRVREQRLADALVELASHSLDSGQVPQQASQRAHLQVTTSLETLLGLAGAPAAEVEFSPPTSARAVQRLACDSTVTRLLLGSDSAVIDVGRARRVVLGATRRALNLRDGGCRWPAGCGRPASWSEAHT